MKSVILCAGEGTRASGYTEGKNKCLARLPNNKTILDYSLKVSLELTDEVIVLIGHKGAEIVNYVEAYVKNTLNQGRIVFAEQSERNGLCQGLLCCESLLDNDDFLLFLGDEFITENMHQYMINDFRESSAFAVCGFVHTAKPDDIRKTYSMELLGNRVIHLEEKPLQPMNNLMGTGNCVFKNVFLDYIRQFQKKAIPGQYFSFPHVLNDAIDNGEIILAKEIGKLYLNFNTEEDIKTFGGYL